MGDDEAFLGISSGRASIPTMDYTTGRRRFEVGSAAIGPDIPPRTVPKTAAGVSDQKKHQFLTTHSKARPSSARVHAAAYRAYGGLGSRSAERPPPSGTIMPHFNTSTSVIRSVTGRRPSSAILGGGYHYPTSRPQTAHEKSSRRQPRSYMQASFEATPDGPLLSGPKMTEAPALQRPMSAGPVPYASRQVYQTSSIQESKGPEQRFSHTLPTDPAAKRIWENLTKRPYFVPPPVTDRVSPRQSQTLSAPSSMQRRLPRPLSGHSVRSSERFTSMPVQQQLVANTQPMTVSGYSLPEEEWAAPPASSAWWQSSRLGRTAIQTLDTRLKMAGNAARSPASDSQLAYAARGAQLSPLRPFQPPPHAVSDEAGHMGAVPDEAGHVGAVSDEARHLGAVPDEAGHVVAVSDEAGNLNAVSGEVGNLIADNDDADGEGDGGGGTVHQQEDRGREGAEAAGKADDVGGDVGNVREQTEDNGAVGDQEAGKGDTDGVDGGESSARKHKEEGDADAGYEAGKDDADRTGGDDSSAKQQPEDDGAVGGTRETGEKSADDNGCDDGSGSKQTEEKNADRDQEEVGKDNADGGNDEGTEKQSEQIAGREQNGAWEGRSAELDIGSQDHGVQSASDSQQTGGDS